MPDIQVHLRQVGPTTSEASLPRDRTILVDRPEAKGGEDKGPMGGEYFESLTLLVSADYDDEELSQHLVRVAEKGCIMVNTLERSVELRVRTGAIVRE